MVDQNDLITDLRAINPVRHWGRVETVSALTVEVSDRAGVLSLGDRVLIEEAGVSCEVVGLEKGRARCLPAGRVDGVRRGARAVLCPDPLTVRPGAGWLGRVIDAEGNPLDGKGPLPEGPAPFPLRAAPPSAPERGRLGGRLDLGVRALNTFAACRAGQRMGIFAGSGVGKSVLLTMLARYAAADVAVIGLIGERGREVREFIEDDLGPEGLARSVVVVATSDEPALRRRQAAYLTLTLSEYFRDQGAHVLCMMDSVTRFAMAQREIGLAAGEPPTAKGYTPSVFAELPRLLERAGPGRDGGTGTTTGLFTVLVEGSDHDEPVADAVRGILDGHIVMERAIAERGRYPAINVLKSVSRTMPGVHEPEERVLIAKARKALSAYEDMEDLIRIGAYRPGSNREVDEAVYLHPELEAYLSQAKDDPTSVEEGFARLGALLGVEDGGAADDGGAASVPATIEGAAA